MWEKVSVTLDRQGLGLVRFHVSIKANQPWHKLDNDRELVTCIEVYADVCTWLSVPYSL